MTTYTRGKTRKRRSDPAEVRQRWLIRKPYIACHLASFDHIQAIDRIAKRERCSRGAVLRRAVEQFLANVDKQTNG